MTPPVWARGLASIAATAALGGCGGGGDASAPERASQSPRTAAPRLPPATPADARGGAGTNTCESTERAARRDVAYLRRGASETAIWAIRGDGRDRRRLAPVPDGAGALASAPGGRRFVLVADRGTTRGDPDVIAVDRGRRRERVLARDVGADPSDPAWAPDGRRIAFTDEFVLKTVAAEGGAPRALVTEMYAQGPSWSPDGEWLVFAGSRRDEAASGHGGAPDLWIVRADGRELRRLTDTPGHPEADPAWSPDGRTIAYNHDSDVASGIWVIGSDGRGRRELTREDDLKPSWSSDCRTLVFGRLEGRRYSVRTASLGGGARTLAGGLTAHPAPGWLVPRTDPRAHPPASRLPPTRRPKRPAPTGRGALTSMANRICTQAAARLRAIGRPRDARTLPGFASSARPVLATAAARLREIAPDGERSRIGKFLGFRDLQVLKLQEIEMGAADAGLRLAIDDVDALERRAAAAARRAGLAACRSSGLPQLASLPGVPPPLPR